MEPHYIVLAETLSREIASLGPNTVLPTERELTKRFGVSRVTVRRAVGMLERSGLLSRQRGRGTVVSPPKVTRSLSATKTIEEDLRQQGVKLETGVLRYEKAISAPDLVHQRLGLPPGTPVGFLALVRTANDRIIAYDRRYFHPVMAARFDPRDIGHRSVNEVVEEAAGSPITVLDWEIEIVSCSHEVAKVLGVTAGVLVVSSIATECVENGMPVQTTSISYRIDRVKFKYSARVTRPAKVRAAD